MPCPTANLPTFAEQSNRRSSAVGANDLSNAPHWCFTNSSAPKRHTSESSIERSPLLLRKLIGAQAPYARMFCRSLPTVAAQTHRRTSTIRANDLSNAPHRCCTNSLAPKHRRRGWSVVCFPLLLRKLIGAQAPYARMVHRTLPTFETQTHRRSSAVGAN